MVMLEVCSEDGVTLGCSEVEVCVGANSVESAVVWHWEVPEVVVQTVTTVVDFKDIFLVLTAWETDGTEGSELCGTKDVELYGTRDL